MKASNVTIIFTALILTAAAAVSATQVRATHTRSAGMTVPSPSETPPAVPAAAERSENEAERPRVARIGIVNPVTEMGKGFEGMDSGAAIRNTLSVALKTDATEIVLLDSALPEQEARQKKCDAVFYSKVTRKKGGGMFGSMGPMLAGAAAGMIPGMGGVVASIATSTVITATSIAGGFKSKDEVAFEYKLAASDATLLLPPTTTKLKAKKDGDDVLTPQIQQAAAAVLQKLATGK